jgi:hypothetical protein
MTARIVDAGRNGLQSATWNRSLVVTLHARSARRPASVVSGNCPNRVSRGGSWLGFQGELGRPSGGDGRSKLDSVRRRESWRIIRFIASERPRQVWVTRRALLAHVDRAPLRAILGDSGEPVGQLGVGATELDQPGDAVAPFREELIRAGWDGGGRQCGGVLDCRQPWLGAWWRGAHPRPNLAPEDRELKRAYDPGIVTPSDCAGSRLPSVPCEFATKLGR